MNADIPHCRNLLSLSMGYLETTPLHAYYKTLLTSRKDPLNNSLKIPLSLREQDGTCYWPFFEITYFT